ncbi:GNAT family N-acetyltransferase [Paracoccus pacificus]|uniref:L-ornithine N(alpha)-acyltransferase n=1 Tax=Paracoccus pacificus TaxID=1463598 RepID=A0ABW4RBQ1_9RHOB
MTVLPDPGPFDVRLARSETDLLSAQRLRYRVFIEEMGGDGALVDHDARLERDEFDPVVDHLLLIDRRQPPGSLDYVVGVYRLLTDRAAEKFGRFYCDAEYDLTPLRRSGRRLLELGRSCVAPEHRGGTGVFLMWNALAEYVLERELEIMFGVASFHGTDVQALAQPLSWLHHKHRAPDDLCPTALPQGFQRMDLVPRADLNQRAAMVGMPALIKAYLRLGGTVGNGAFLDHEFNTTDVFLLMDTARMSQRHRGFYARRAEGPGA